MKIFVLEHCPHCNRARQWIKELQEENTDYQNINIEYIDEEKNSDLANKYDYYYVPSIFVDEKKIHEGIASKEIIKEIFNDYLSRI